MNYRCLLKNTYIFKNRSTSAIALEKSQLVVLDYDELNTGIIDGPVPASELYKENPPVYSRLLAYNHKSLIVCKKQTPNSLLGLV